MRFVTRHAEEIADTLLVEPCCIAPEVVEAGAVAPLGEPQAVEDARNAYRRCVGYGFEQFLKSYRPVIKRDESELILSPFKKFWRERFDVSTDLNEYVVVEVFEPRCIRAAPIQPRPCREGFTPSYCQCVVNAR